MESLRKIPSGWGCEKSLCLSHLEKKGKNILETGLFLSQDSEGTDLNSAHSACIPIALLVESATQR